MFRGEAARCIIPEKTLEYDFVYKLLYSNIGDNVMGAINYLFENYKKQFIADLKKLKIRFDIQGVQYNQLYEYFRNGTFFW
jgi:hypothetical protein